VVKLVNLPSAQSLIKPLAQWYTILYFYADKYMYYTYCDYVLEVSVCDSLSCLA